MVPLKKAGIKLDAFNARIINLTSANKNIIMNKHLVCCLLIVSASFSACPQSTTLTSVSEKSIETAPKLSDADFPQPTPSARHNEKVNAIKESDYDLVLIGDSITHTLHNFGGKYDPMTKRVWDKYYAPHRAINLGYSGYRTEQILWHLQNGELDFKTSPKAFMILIGTNNLDERHFKIVHTPEQVFAGTKAIVDLIRQRHSTSKILLMRIFPRGGDNEISVSPPHFNSSAKTIASARRAGELTQQLADDKHVFWLDVGHIFLRTDGSINTDNMWDLLHPSPAGAEAWAREVEPILAKWIGDKSVSVSHTLSSETPASTLSDNLQHR